MGSAITAIFRADGKQMISEMEKTQIVGQGLARTLPATWERSFTSAFANIKQQFTNFNRTITASRDDFGFSKAVYRPDAHREAMESLKRDVAKIQGANFSTPEESQAAAEARRQASVEEAARSNRARALLRGRAEERAEARRAAAQEREEAIAAAVAEAKAVGDARTAAEVEAAARSNRARMLWRERAAATEAKRLAQIEAVATVARQGVAQPGGAEHGGSGASGIIGEMLVLFREAGRGNWSRVPGSLTILAQRTGLLGTVIRSTAAAEVEMAAASNKAAVAGAREAMIATQRAEASAAAALAAGGDDVALNAEAAALDRVAVSARGASVALTAKATADARAAESALMVASVSFWPIAAAVALVALGVAAYFVIKHYKLLHEEQRNAEALGKAGTQTYEDQAAAMDRAAEAARDFARWLGHLNDEQNDLVRLSNQAVEALRNQAQADQALREAKKEGDLAAVDLEVKKGKITPEEGAKKKAGIEKAAIEAEAKAKQDALNAEADRREQDYRKAQQQQQQAVARAAAAEAKANESPEAVARHAQADANARKFKEAQEVVAALEKRATEQGLKPDDVQHIDVNGQHYGLSINKAREIAEHDRQAVEADKDAQSPEDQAAAEARKQADAATEALKTVKQAGADAARAANENAKNSPALVAQKERNIDLKLEDEILGGGGAKGFSLNQQQRVGAYASTPPDLAEIKKTLLKIAQNTERPPSYNPPAGPFFGGR